MLIIFGMFSNDERLSLQHFNKNSTLLIYDKVYRDLPSNFSLEFLHSVECLDFEHLIQRRLYILVTNH